MVPWQWVQTIRVFRRLARMACTHGGAAQVVEVFQQRGEAGDLVGLGVDIVAGQHDAGVLIGGRQDVRPLPGAFDGRAGPTLPKRRLSTAVAIRGGRRHP